MRMGTREFPKHRNIFQGVKKNLENVIKIINNIYGYMDNILLTFKIT